MTIRERIMLEEACLVGEDFSGRKLSQLTVVSSKLVRCRFDKVHVSQACFGGGRQQSTYEECTFDGMRFSAPAPGNARFVRCSFREVRIKDFIGRHVELVDCVFSGRIENAVFHGGIAEEEQEFVGRKQNEFCGNDFRAADLVDVSFRGGIDLEKQGLPSGAGYFYFREAFDALQRARKIVLDMKDLDARRRAMALLTVLDRAVDGGQRQLLLRPESMPTEVRAVATALCETLRSGAKRG